MPFRYFIFISDFKYFGYFFLKLGPIFKEPLDIFINWVRKIIFSFRFNLIFNFFLKKVVANFFFYIIIFKDKIAFILNKLRV